MRYLKHLHLQRSMLCVELAVLKNKGSTGSTVKSKKGTLAYSKSSYITKILIITLIIILMGFLYFQFNALRSICY
jgi:hypothetical protein